MSTVHNPLLPYASTGFEHRVTDAMADNTRLAVQIDTLTQVDDAPDDFLEDFPPIPEGVEIEFDGSARLIAASSLPYDRPADRTCPGKDGKTAWITAPSAYLTAALAA